MTQINMPSVNTPMIGDSLYKNDDDIFKDYFRKKKKFIDDDDIDDDSCPFFEEDLCGVEDECQYEDDGDCLFDNL